MDYWAVKTDKEGTLIWEKTFGGYAQDEVFSVRQISGGNFYLAGTSNSNANGDKSQDVQGMRDYWLLKLDATGNKVWDKRFGGSKDDILRASTYTDEGHFILAGQSYSEVSGDKSQASQGAGDYWVVEVDENGQKVQDQRFGGSGEDELRTVTQTKDGGLLLGGRSNSGVSGDRTQPSQGGTDYWLVKVAPTTTSIVAARETTLTVEVTKPTELTPLMAYPNPFQGQLSVRFSLPQTQLAIVKVLDSQGREIKTLYQGEAKAKQTYQVEWQADNKAAGMYLLQLQTPTKLNTQKVLLNK
ncbi:T9SS type A sorting domain-containing protein [Adhaeribacter radiodurans]|uniref:T9SS type A sorting domain-containing protein n=1 Tax=Adhaeribacter radiodurans TaxID=2745197 RepID=A0A7L7L4Y2_9BACT|nr:T9SS type A sorting domain-containing protein [Adhaeribacter radiodurans]QMU27871.1 T9SS type A sorting domain-containing protein [Adhaeribacter radiodurans]